MFMLVGIAGYLFVPMAEAVVFAMLASSLLSRTLVPTLAKYWLQRHDAHAPQPPHGLPQLLQRRFEEWFTRVRAGYHALLERALTSGPRFAVPFLAAMAATALLTFPFGHYLPPLPLTLSACTPSTTFACLPADFVSQPLNFGLPAPLDVQVSGFNVAANRAYAIALLERMPRIPGVVDLRIQQAFDYPTLNVVVDRSKAALLGLSETDVASDLLVSLSGSSQTTLSFWID